VVGSNFVLIDKKLNIDARKPFRRWSGTPTNSELCAWLEDIRTFVTEQSQEINKLTISAKELLFEDKNSAD